MKLRRGLHRRMDPCRAAGAVTMIRMTNHQSFSRRRVLAAGLAAIALLSIPALAQAYPSDRRETGSATGPRGRRDEYPPVKINVPAPTGPNGIGTTELHLVDHARDDASAPAASGS